MSIPGVYGQPRGLKQARIVMWVQVVFSVLGSIFLLVLAAAASSADDASGVGGLLVVVGVVMSCWRWHWACVRRSWRRGGRGRG
jgi:hypothetical protein